MQGECLYPKPYTLSPKPYSPDVLFPKMQDHDNTVEGILSSHPCELP